MFHKKEAFDVIDATDPLVVAENLESWTTQIIARVTC